MTVLILRNSNSEAIIQQLSFNLETGHFLTENNQIVTRHELVDLAFTHPILREDPLTETGKHQYSYIYHNDIEFCLALRYLYATLLQADNPAACSFRIQPAEQYFLDTKQYELYFSCHPKKAARQRLRMSQVNSMMTDIYGSPFQYCNHIVLDKTLTWVDLPKEMTADALYHSPEQNWSPHQACLEQVELRFINERIAFGLFARTPIQKGALISQYCGELVAKDIENKSYSYIPLVDGGYQLCLDAKHVGNVGRFLNHAPVSVTKPTRYLSANVKAEDHWIYGTRHIMLFATKDILPGEQLLSSYGNVFFIDPEAMLYIKPNGIITDHKHRRIKNRYEKTKPCLTVFAQYGIKRAQWLLIRKPLIVLLLCIGFGAWFRH